jgi:hypothetical protein
MSKKEQLKNLFYQLKKNQQTLFNMMYGSIDTIADDRVDWALKQVERTLQKNIDNLDKKIDQIISTNPIAIPNISTNIIQKLKTKPEPEFSQDGKTPQKGDIFYYQSKYNKNILEGEVDHVYHNSIRSKNGASYKFSEITIKTKSELREEIINKIIE